MFWLLLHADADLYLWVAVQPLTNGYLCLHVKYYQYVANIIDVFDYNAHDVTVCFLFLILISIVHFVRS